MAKPLFLFVGPSGSGKTTVANMIEEQYGYVQVQSYTTRPKRYEGETGHIFISKEEFDKLENLAAYTKYNGYEYCTTSAQLDECDIYVIDPPGVKTLLKRYNNRPIRIVYFDSTVKNRIERMVDRGDSDTEIVGRLHNDEAYDWYEELQDIASYYTHKQILVRKIDANTNEPKVLSQVLDYILVVAEYYAQEDRSGS